LAGTERFHDFIEFGHPTEREVAIRKKYPRSFFGTDLYHAERRIK